MHQLASLLKKIVLLRDLPDTAFYWNCEVLELYAEVKQRGRLKLKQLRN